MLDYRCSLLQQQKQQTLTQPKVSVEEIGVSDENIFMVYIFIRH